MLQLPHDDERVTSLVQAIESGDIESISRLLEAHPTLAATRVVLDEEGSSSTFLHAATNWPGGFANVAETIRLLVAAGADVNARCAGKVVETPLHFAASANDVTAIDALVKHGADLEMDGAVLDGGTALADAVNFENWDAARRLVEHGAKTKLGEEAALGMLAKIRARFGEVEPPGEFARNWGFWMACSTGEKAVAEFLLAQGAQVNWVADWDERTALDLAAEGEHDHVTTWLQTLGGKSITELNGGVSG